MGAGFRETRRVSSSGRAQQLWDAIKAVRLQKQIPAITRMGRYMNRFYQLKKDETQRLLDLAVQDNLIKLENKIGTKGTKNGVEEKAYRLPTSDMFPRERHDWYCFQCHTGGLVLCCSTCHRVYHSQCLNIEEDKEKNMEEFICNYCQAFQRIPETFNKRERRDLNNLFRLIYFKLKKKIPEQPLAREVPSPPSRNVWDPTDQQQIFLQQQQIDGQSTNPILKKIEQESWRATFLLKQQIEFSDVERKCNGAEYRDIEEFKADVQLIVHNLVVYHGVHSAMADTARQIFRDTISDLRNIELCRDCFRYSSETDDKYWFTKPCRPAHVLVYAQQKGFPYWPAKVIKILDNNSNYDVRFFGGYHQRALVDKHHIKPISVNIHTLQVKRTSAWNKACEELRKHQEYLSKVRDNVNFFKDPYGNPFVSCDFRVEFQESEIEGFSDSENEERYPGDDSRTKDEDLLYRKPLTISGESTSASFTQMSVPEFPLVMTQQPSNASIGIQNDNDNDRIILTETHVEEGSGKKKRGRPKKMKKEEPEDFVSSSSQPETRFINAGVQTPSKLLKPFQGSSQASSSENANTSTVVTTASTSGLSIVSAAAAASSRKPTEREFKEFAEKLRADFEQEKKRAVNVATRSLERDLERLKADHITEMEELSEKHNQEVSENKKKQWCFHCESEAIYWCCWNTAYCSIECQQDHWHKEHKRACRRKR